MKRQSGFTLVELIIVIIVVGILAGIAIPRFINQTRNARIAELNGLAGAINAAIALAQGEYKAEGVGTSPILLSGTSVAVSTGSAGGVPIGAASGIGAAVRSVNGFSPTYGATTQWDFFTAIPHCNVQYSASTGHVKVNTTGC